MCALYSHALKNLSCKYGILLITAYVFIFRNVKASSPWLNVILLVGVIVRLPTTLYDGLIFSANKYAILKGTDFTLLCYVRNVSICHYVHILSV